MAPLIPGYQSNTITISDGDTVSDAADLNQFTLTALLVPAAMEGSSLTFQGSIDGTNFFPINSPDTAGQAISVTINTAAAIIPLITDNFAGVRYMKVVAASAQTGDAAIELLSIRATGGRG